MSNYSIVITTFDKRFEKWLKPLVLSIKQLRPNIEVILMVNGRANESFNEAFRADILNFASQNPNTFVNMFTSFQSLAKLWNRGILTASSEHCLVLNDDLTIPTDLGSGQSIFDQLDGLVQTHDTFRLNGSFSHYVMSKKELMEVGFFDERLLGIGEEDGDFYWRYYQHYQKEIPSLDVTGILQPQLEDGVLVQESDDGFKKGVRHYSQFNRNFIKNEKYQRALIGGYKGMFDHRVKSQLSNEKQYPYEEFYQQRKHEL
jgi:glycosyltransferase involved in cell wall biosynthesis